uniref:CACTA en-spm transposon protein n=1 Tax=Cucumis melo TaxID=3656 RepID=A0A9I9E5Y1_CUCME
MDAMFLEFAKYLDSFMGGSSLVGDNSGTSQPSVTLTPRRRAQSRPLELEHYVVANGQILMTTTLGTVKPIFPHVVCFSQTIDVCVRKTFSIRYLKWVYVGREYIEVVKGDLQRFFVLDFNDQAMNRFVVHQMLNTFKEFWVDRHRHFTKYSDPEKARANPLYLLSNHRRTKLLDRSNLTIIAAGQSCFYNNSTSLLSKEWSRLTIWSYFDKHMFEMGRSCSRLWRMHKTRSVE